jgi:DNA (cytosine-5)-methyltransferase 1
MSGEPNSKSFIELFAGVGGFRIALEKAGWNHSWSNQWEPSTKAQHASDCYVKNFGPAGHSNEDISKIAELLEIGELQLPKADLLVGGFPCQDYSVAKSANSALGLQGKKGVLWWEILRLTRAIQPRFLLLENVDRLLKSPSSNRGRDFAVMLKTLSAEGYQIEWRVVNSADYGEPQRRKRVFVFAEKSQKTFSNPKSTVINRALPVEGDFYTTEFELPADIVAISDSFNVGGKTSPFGSWGRVSGNTVVTGNPIPIREAGPKLGDILEPSSEVGAEFWISSEEELSKWKFQKGAKSIERQTKEGYTYFYSEGKMSFPDSLESPSRTVLTGEGGRSPSRFKHVVMIDGRYRRLTPKELERLNGFPDDWTRFATSSKEFSNNRRAFFMGNALVVGIVQRIAAEIHSEPSE